MNNPTEGEKRPRNLSEVKRIGFALQNRRSDAGVSRQRLAEVSGTSAYYIGQIERGEVDPRLSLVLKLGSAIGWVIR